MGPVEDLDAFDELAGAVPRDPLHLVCPHHRKASPGRPFVVLHHDESVHEDCRGHLGAMITVVILTDTGLINLSKFI